MRLASWSLAGEVGKSLTEMPAKLIASGCFFIIVCNCLARAQDLVPSLRSQIDRHEFGDAESQRSGRLDSDPPFVPIPQEGPEKENQIATEDEVDEQRFLRWMEKYRRKEVHEDRSTDVSQNEMFHEKIGSLDAEMKDLRERLDGTATGKWQPEGLVFTSSSGNYKTHYGGLVQYDVVGYPFNSGLTVPSGAGTQTGVEARRLRLRAEGTMYQNIDWVMEFDLAGALQNVDPGTPSAQNNGLSNTTTGIPPGSGDQSGNVISVIQPTTVFATLKDVPVVGNVRIGNQEYWLSLEHLISARFQDFMERSPIMDAFIGPNNNGYAPGVSFFNHAENKMATWQFGAYNNTAYVNGYTYEIGNEWSYGGRLTWTPYFDEVSKGRYLVHTGLGVEYRQFDTYVTRIAGFDNVRVRSRGVLRTAASTLTPNFADTGNFFATGQTIINPEMAIIWDRWTFMGEVATSYFYGARTNKGATGANNFGTVMMYGGYVQSLYYLTGEHKEYNRTNGTFGRLIPRNNLNLKDGTKGAWQVGVRYDWLNLNAGAIRGGLEQDLTLGVNWHWNPNARIQFNYVFAHVSNSGRYLPTTPGNETAGPYGSMVGSRFGGEGSLQLVGTRLDFNF